MREKAPEPRTQNPEPRTQNLTFPFSPTEVPRFDLFGGHYAFYRRKVKDDPKDCGQCSVGVKNLIVEDKVLEHTALNGHENGAPCRCDGGHDTFRAGLEG